MVYCVKRALFVAVALLCLSGCKLANLKRVKVAPSPVNVSVMVVSESSNVSQRSYVGTFESAKEAIVSSTHSGTLVSFDVKAGQTLRPDEVVARVESQTIANTYKSAKATLEQAKDGYERARKVYGSGSISEVKMVEIQTRLAQAEAMALSAENALDECRVRVPFSGKVAEVFVHQGERVIAGQPLFSIIDAGGLEVVISVPESEVAGIEPGARAKVSFPSLENDDVVTSEVGIVATVKSKSLVSNNLSHSYKCTLSLHRQPRALMSGMVCKVFMDRDNAKGIIVPAEIVKLDDEGKYIWTVEDGVVCKSRVVPGGFSGKGVIIDSGLKLGDVIITEGISKVSSGMKVNIVQ